jgi:hypothetical protein
MAVLLPAYAQDLVLTLENKTGSDLVELYASPSDVDEWEEDILGLDILASGIWPLCRDPDRRWSQPMSL